MYLIFGAALALAVNSAASGSDATADSLQYYFCEEVKKPFFAPDPEDPRLYRPQRHQAVARPIALPKPAGTKRVFVLGESVASLLGYPYVGGWLDDGLRRVGLGRAPRVEFVNCGMGGYESWRIYKLLLEVLQYQPDLVVILSGNNETGEPCRGADFELRRRKFRLLDRYYSIAGHGNPGKKASLKMHGDMLTRMAAAAKKAGVPAVFCTLPANLRDMPPGSRPPLHDRGFAEGFRLFHSGDYAAARRKFGPLAAKDAFAAFYAAKADEKLGKTKEAAAGYEAALDLDPSLLRGGSERNAMIRRVAGENGACVAGLDRLFAGLARGGMPGFDEFTDGVHWRPAYNAAVWREIFRSAAACGLKGFEGLAVRNGDWKTETPREDARKRLSYLVSWLAGPELNEQSLAQLDHLSKVAPELLKSAARSPEALGALFIANFWSQGTAERLRALYPAFLAHLAEAARRRREPVEALALCGRALDADPGNPEYRLIRAQALADLGRKAEAAGEFGAAAASQNCKERAAAMAAAYGIELNKRQAAVSYAGPPGPRLVNAASKTLSDEAGGRMEAGDYAAAEELLLKALKMDAANTEALMDLCVIKSRKKESRKALDYCRSAARTVYGERSRRQPAGETLACEAAIQAYRLASGLGNPGEAAELIRECLRRGPADWPGRKEAEKAAASLGAGQP